MEGKKYVIKTKSRSLHLLEEVKISLLNKEWIIYIKESNQEVPYVVVAFMGTNKLLNPNKAKITDFLGQKLAYSLKKKIDDSKAYLTSEVQEIYKNILD